MNIRNIIITSCALGLFACAVAQLYYKGMTGSTMFLFAAAAVVIGGAVASEISKESKRPKREVKPLKAAPTSKQGDISQELMPSLLAVAGVLCVGYFWGYYDTVAEGSDIHNLARGQNQMIGIIVGLGLAILGGVLYPKKARS